MRIFQRNRQIKFVLVDNNKNDVAKLASNLSLISITSCSEIMYMLIGRTILLTYFF